MGKKTAIVWTEVLATMGEKMVGLVWTEVLIAMHKKTAIV
jgi:hypothetical protein